MTGRPWVLMTAWTGWRVGLPVPLTRQTGACVLPVGDSRNVIDV
jgi:hypothetical protein